MCDAGPLPASGQGELGQDHETLAVLRQVARLSEARIPAHIAPAQLDRIRDLVGAELWRLPRLSRARNESLKSGVV